MYTTLWYVLIKTTFITPWLNCLLITKCNIRIGQTWTVYQHDSQSVYCMRVLPWLHITRNSIQSIYTVFHFDRHISPEISLKLITYLLKSQGNWPIMFPLSQTVPGIANCCSVISQLARGITKNNLTRWHGTLIVSVPGHGVRQGMATFMLRLTLMNNIIDAIVWAKLQPAAIWAAWDILEATILDESSHSED